jgi:hypothetical protein
VPPHITEEVDMPTFFGQLNHLAGLDLGAKLFPAVDDWRDLRRTMFDPNRTFDAPVTRRLGL